MSLILDALNRSSQDAGQVPGLGTVHYQDRPEGDGRARRRQLLLVAALAIALAAITWLLLDRRQAPVATVEPGQRAAQPVRPDTRPETRPAATVSRSETAAVAERPSASMAAATVSLPPPPVQAPVPAPAAAGPAVAAGNTARNRRVEVAVAKSESAASAAREASVAELYRQQRSAGSGLEAAEAEADREAKATVRNAAGKREEQPVDIEQMVLQAREELKNASLVEHDAPFIVTLSQQTKDRIPTLLYSRHDYSGNPGQSSVVLNGKALKVGASTNGIKVEEILPDSVVLSFQGTRFRLRALNSWVNL